MKSEIVPIGFEFKGIQVSAFVDEFGRDWFRGSEVCKILQIANPATVIKREASKYWKEIQVGVGRPALYVSEPGLYSLIFASKQPIAEKFKEWVFEEVLPKLRADGGYIMPNATSEQIRALTGKYNYLEQKHRREVYPLFREIAALNAPNLKPVGRQRTSAEKNADFLAQREIYFQCWNAWEASASRRNVRVTLEEADAFLPAQIKRPWEAQS